MNNRRELEPSLLEKSVDTGPGNLSAEFTNSASAHDGLHDSGKNGLYLSEEDLLSHARKYPHSQTKLYLKYSPYDKENPRNWSPLKKWYITCLVCMSNVLTCVCAGGISCGASQIATEFNVSGEITTLALSLYILGFAVGPLLLAPLSEYYGRNPIYIWGWLLLVIFNIPIALARNIGTILVCRFLGGFFGGAPLTNTGGTVSDLWARNVSGLPMAVYGSWKRQDCSLALIH